MEQLSAFKRSNEMNEIDVAAPSKPQSTMRKQHTPMRHATSSTGLGTPDTDWMFGSTFLTMPPDYPDSC
jgi:hypothetical protein